MVNSWWGVVWVHFSFELVNPHALIVSTSWLLCLLLQKLLLLIEVGTKWKVNNHCDPEVFDVFYAIVGTAEVPDFCRWKHGFHIINLLGIENSAKSVLLIHFTEFDWVAVRSVFIARPWDKHICPQNVLFLEHECTYVSSLWCWMCILALVVRHIAHLCWQFYFNTIFVLHCVKIMRDRRIQARNVFVFSFCMLYLMVFTKKCCLDLVTCLIAIASSTNIEVSMYVKTQLNSPFIQVIYFLCCEILNWLVIFFR